MGSGRSGSQAVGGGEGGSPAWVRRATRKALGGHGRTRKENRTLDCISKCNLFSAVQGGWLPLRRIRAGHMPQTMMCTNHIAHGQILRNRGKFLLPKHWCYRGSPPMLPLESSEEVSASSGNCLTVGASCCPETSCIQPACRREAAALDEGNVHLLAIPSLFRVVGHRPIRVHCTFKL